MILTSEQGRNKDIVPNIMTLYAQPGQVITDVTYGSGNFWTDVDTTQYDFRPTDLLSGTDMRCLPYDTESVDMLFLDPPYIYNPKKTVKASIADTYAVNDTDSLETTDDIIALYADAMIEARRVLRSKTGVLVVKCQDGIESGKQRWNHITLFNVAVSLGFIPEDLFILVQESQPTIRWEDQKHARKNHSYFWVLKRGR